MTDTVIHRYLYVYMYHNSNVCLVFHRSIRSVSVKCFNKSTIFFFTISADSNMFLYRFHFTEKKKITWCHIWRIWTMLKCSNVFVDQKLFCLLKMLCEKIHCLNEIIFPQFSFFPTLSLSFVKLPYDSACLLLCLLELILSKLCLTTKN